MIKVKLSQYILDTYQSAFKSLMAGLFVFANMFLANDVLGQITQVTGSPTSNTTTTATLTINKPSGLAINDVMIVSIIQTDNDNNTLSNATSSGWSLIDGREIESNGDDEWWGTLLYKVAVAGDVAAANFSFTLDGDANGDNSEGAIIAFRGVNVTGGFTATGAAGGPFDLDPGIINNIASDAQLNASTITTATANAGVIMFGFIANDLNLSNWQTTSPGALTEIYDLPLNVSEDMGIGSAWAIKAATGATGAGSATISGSAPNGSLLIALRACVPPAVTQLEEELQLFVLVQ